MLISLILFMSWPLFSYICVCTYVCRTEEKNVPDLEIYYLILSYN